MADKTGIEWTDASWNPVVGCSIVSPGCTNCYAMKQAYRIEKMSEGAGRRSHYAGTTQQSKAGAVWTGKVNLAPDHIITQPLRWKRPRRIFVNSMSDLFHEDIPDDWIDKVFAVMILCPQHTFQVLTKRANRMSDYITDHGAPFRVSRVIDGIKFAPGSEEEKIIPIENYPGYFVSSHGYIYSEKHGTRRKMKPDTGEQGHQRVQLYRDNAEKRGDRFLVHRLVLEAFVGPAPSPKAQGRHRDGNPTNNALSNLIWGDQYQNWLDSKRHGTHRRHSKLSHDQVIEIRDLHEAGENGEILARKYDVSATQIRNIVRGDQWSIEPEISWPPENCWLGVSVEDQARADERIPSLLSTPAAVRFISFEPLLGPVDVTPYIQSLNWAIVGGESGPGARPMHPDWARSLRDQCQAAGVPFFMKQMTKKEAIPNDLLIREYPNV